LLRVWVNGFNVNKDTPVEQVTFVGKVAQKLINLGLAAPAVLLLEAHKPLAFIGCQCLLLAQPTLNLFISPYLTQGFVDLLADPDQLDQLIAHLEQPNSLPLDPKNHAAGTPEFSMSNKETCL
jgi:hypothetical protein